MLTGENQVSFYQKRKTPSFLKENQKDSFRDESESSPAVPPWLGRKTKKAPVTAPSGHTNLTQFSPAVISSLYQ
jgi:hypothetical protein